MQWSWGWSDGSGDISSASEGFKPRPLQNKFKCRCQLSEEFHRLDEYFMSNIEIVGDYESRSTQIICGYLDSIGVFCSFPSSKTSVTFYTKDVSSVSTTKIKQECLLDVTFSTIALQIPESLCEEQDLSTLIIRTLYTKLLASDDCFALSTENQRDGVIGRRSPETIGPHNGYAVVELLSLKSATVSSQGDVSILFDIDNISIVYTPLVSLNVELTEPIIFFPTGELIYKLSETDAFLTGIDRANRLRGYSTYLPSNIAEAQKYWKFNFGIALPKSSDCRLFHISSSESNELDGISVPGQVLVSSVQLFPAHTRRYVETQSKSFLGIIESALTGLCMNFSSVENRIFDLSSISSEDNRSLGSSILISALKLRREHKQGVANNSLSPRKKQKATEQNIICSHK